MLEGTQILSLFKEIFDIIDNYNVSNFKKINIENIKTISKKFRKLINYKKTKKNSSIISPYR